jgi:transcriptional regulator with XRE-family HTH domain
MKLNNKYKSPAYWTQLIQLMLYDNIKSYLSEQNMSKKEFATKLGVSKGYISQILNGDFDHKLSKLTELALACDLIPKIEFVPIEYAEQIAKDVYIQPTDWKKCNSYYNTLPLDLRQPSHTVSFEKMSCNSKSCDYIVAKSEAWQSQDINVNKTA